MRNPLTRYFSDWDHERPRCSACGAFDFTGHHQICPNRLVKCVCQEQYQAKDQESHLQHCTLKGRSPPPPPIKTTGTSKPLPPKKVPSAPVVSRSGFITVLNGIYLDNYILWNIASYLDPLSIIFFGSTTKVLQSVCNDENLWLRHLKTQRPDGWKDPMEIKYKLEAKEFKIIGTGKCKERFLEAARRLRAMDVFYCFFCKKQTGNRRWWKTCLEREAFFTFPNETFYISCYFVHESAQGIVVCCECCFMNHFPCSLCHKTILIDAKEIRAVVRKTKLSYLCHNCRGDQ